MIVKLLSKVVNPLKLVTWLLGGAGEGNFGPGVKAAYWALAGKKSWIIAAGAAVFAFLATLSQDPTACGAVRCDTILDVLTKWWPEILAALGIAALDDAIRSEPPTR